MALGNSTGHPNMYCPNSNQMVGSRQKPVWNLVATWVTEFYINCSRNLNPDMVLGSILGLVVSMAPHGGEVHGDLHGLHDSVPMDPNTASGVAQTTGTNMTLHGNKSHGHQHRPWLLYDHDPRHGLWQHLSWVPTWPRVANRSP